jgi:hypothetical protein
MQLSKEKKWSDREFLISNNTYLFNIFVILKNNTKDNLLAIIKVEIK